jgi:hypothetical protein
MPGQSSGLRRAVRLGEAVRDVHTRRHKNARRRRLRLLKIERHHKTEQPAI